MPEKDAEFTDPGHNAWYVLYQAATLAHPPGGEPDAEAGTSPAAESTQPGQEVQPAYVFHVARRGEHVPVDRFRSGSDAVTSGWNAGVEKHSTHMEQMGLFLDSSPHEDKVGSP